MTGRWAKDGVCLRKITSKGIQHQFARHTPSLIFDRLEIVLGAMPSTAGNMVYMKILPPRRAASLTHTIHAGHIIVSLSTPESLVQLIIISQLHVCLARIPGMPLCKQTTQHLYSSPMLSERGIIRLGISAPSLPTTPPPQAINPTIKAAIITNTAPKPPLTTDASLTSASTSVGAALPVVVTLPVAAAFLAPLPVAVRALTTTVTSGAVNKAVAVAAVAAPVMRPGPCGAVAVK